MEHVQYERGKHPVEYPAISSFSGCAEDQISSYAITSHLQATHEIISRAGDSIFEFDILEFNRSSSQPPLD